MLKLLIFATVVGALSVFLSHFFRTLPSPIVEIANGKLQGRVASSRDGLKYFEYLSIPYAEPPIDKLRFEPPMLLTRKWDSVKQATKYPPVCLQMDILARGILVGEEDCLYLNVFTRGIGGKRPVLVFIHGGAFIMGGTDTYHPLFFMDEDIVLVTLQYRLGPLGFLNVGSIRGNMGLKDQLLAMKWIQQNIDKFGGDPQRVMLFGESAGAASVHYHMISHSSKGLFQRAALLSGAVDCPFAFKHSPNEIATNFFKETKCSDKNGDDLADCIKSMDAKELVKISEKLMDPRSPVLLFTPSVETIVREDTFIAENPRNLVKNNKMGNPVPSIFSITSAEGLLRTAKLEAFPDLIPEIIENWKGIAAPLLVSDEADISSEIAEKMQLEYFPNASLGNNLHELKRNFTKLASDVIFYGPVRKAVMTHSKFQPTYMFYYDYLPSILPSSFSLFRAVRNDDWLHSDIKMALKAIQDIFKRKLGLEGTHEFGACHSDDLLMLWNFEGWLGYLTWRDRPLSKSFVKVLVDFANQTDLLQFNGIPWPAVDGKSKAPRYMEISREPKVIDEPITDRIRFWESLNMRE